MKNKRRDFIKSLSSSIAAGYLFSSVGVPSVIDEFEEKLEAFDNLQLDESEKFWKKVSDEFKFEKGLKYFNNGSLGASSVSIQKATNLYRKTLDEYPSKYMWGGWRTEIEATRSKVAGLFSVDSEEIALIHNTTEGMNLIARSFDLQEGDEVILADHEHTSGSVCWKVFQEEKGVTLVRPTLPLMPDSVEDLVAAYRDAITPRTKVISMCHVVNTNGMMLPVREVSEMAHERGIYVAVDGAQSAGMFNIDLKDLGCDFYTASAHKWLFAPKGIGVFYAKKSSQEILRPLIVCRGYKDESIRRLENYNTRNLPELLGLGAAIDFYHSIGQQKIHDRSFQLKAYFRSKIENNPNFKIKSPASNQLSSAIQVVEVTGHTASTIKNKLFQDYEIDCRSMSSFDLNALRISLAIFITKKDIDYLVSALEEIAG